MQAQPTKELNMSIDRDKGRGASDVGDTLNSDELNEVVDHIRAIYKLNKQERNLSALSKLRVGDKVKLTGSYKPNYLSNLTGEIVAKRNTRVTVKLDCGPIGKFRSGQVIATPAGLTVLEDES